MTTVNRKPPTKREWHRMCECGKLMNKIFTHLRATGYPTAIFRVWQCPECKTVEITK